MMKKTRAPANQNPYSDLAGLAGLATATGRALMKQDGSSSLGMRVHANFDEVSAAGETDAGVVPAVPVQCLRSRRELAIRGQRPHAISFQVENLGGHAFGTGKVEANRHLTIPRGVRGEREQ